MTITQKKHRKESCRAKLFTLQNKAKKENRELTSEEEQELTAILEEIEKIDEEIASKRDELLALNDKKEEYNSAKREFDEKLEDKPIEEDGNRKGERFSLTRAIRAIANNEGLRDAELRAVERGKRAQNEQGVGHNGQIVLQMSGGSEKRDILAGTGIYGGYAVETDLLNILDPLRNELVLQKAGATIISGLKGNVAIPSYSGTTAEWAAGEAYCANDSSGTFEQQNISPLRLTQVLNISKRFLIQDSAGVDEMLRRDILRAVEEQLEKTLLGSQTGLADNYPAGLASYYSTYTNITDWQDTVQVESQLATQNYNGDYKYILSPYAYGALSVLPKDAGSGLFALTDGKLNGYDVLRTNSVASQYGYLGVWNLYNIYLWDSIDIVVDNFSRSRCQEIQLVVNMFVNGAPREKNAFKSLYLS